MVQAQLIEGELVEVESEDRLSYQPIKQQISREIKGVRDDEQDPQVVSLFSQGAWNRALT